MAPHNQHRSDASQLRLFPETLPSRGSMVLAAGRLLVSDDRSLAAWQPLGVEAVRQRYSNEQTCDLMIGNVVRLFRFLDAHGVHTWDDVTHGLVHKWCWASRLDRYGRLDGVLQNTARHREWAAFVVFEELAKLGCPVDPAALIEQRIPPSPASVSVRPLDADEEHLAKRYADTGVIGSRRSLIFAVNLCGSSAREAALMRARDIDLDAATVTFGGSAPRTNALDDWSARTVERWWKCLPEQPEPDELVCLTRRLTVDNGARSIGTQLGNVLQEAGIRHRPGVSAGSIRLTGARHVFEQHGIEAAARFLGAESLDRTAEALRHCWREGGDA